MSWFKKTVNRKCTYQCPILKKSLQAAVDAGLISIKDTFSEYDEKQTLVRLENNQDFFMKDIDGMQKEINYLKKQIESKNETLTPDAVRRLIMRVECVKRKEEELWSIVCRQASKISNLEERLEKLEGKADLNINIITPSNTVVQKE